MSWSNPYLFVFHFPVFFLSTSITVSTLSYPSSKCVPLYNLIHILIMIVYFCLYHLRYLVDNACLLKILNFCCLPILLYIYIYYFTQYCYLVLFGAHPICRLFSPLLCSVLRGFGHMGTPCHFLAAFMIAI